MFLRLPACPLEHLDRRPDDLGSTRPEGCRRQGAAEVRGQSSSLQNPSGAGGSAGKLWELVLRAGVGRAVAPGLRWSILSLLLRPSVNLENIEQQPGSTSEAHLADMSSSLLRFFSTASGPSESSELLRSAFLPVWSQEEPLSPPQSASAS